MYLSSELPGQYIAMWGTSKYLGKHLVQTLSNCRPWFNPFSLMVVKQHSNRKIHLYIHLKWATHPWHFFGKWRFLHWLCQFLPIGSRIWNWVIDQSSFSMKTPNVMLWFENLISAFGFSINWDSMVFQSMGLGWVLYLRNLPGWKCPSKRRGKGYNFPQINWFTLPETNIALESRSSQKESSLPTVTFQILGYVRFREGNGFWLPTVP